MEGSTRISVIIAIASLLSIGVLLHATLKIADTKKHQAEEESQIATIASCLNLKDGRDYTVYNWRVLKDRSTGDVVSATGATPNQIRDCLNRWSEVQSVR